MRPSPPEVSLADPVFYDENRHALTYVDLFYGPVSRIWTLPDTGSRAWTSAPVASPSLNGYSLNWWAYDPARDRLLFVSAFETRADTCCAPFYRQWYQVDQLHLGNSPAFSSIPIDGPSPPPAHEYSVAYDPRRQRLYVVGGADLRDGMTGSAVYALALSGKPTWTDLHVEGMPLGRRSARAIVDPVSDRLFLWGGVDRLGFRADSLWTLSLSDPRAWETWACPDTLPRMDLAAPASLTLDEAGRRLLLYTNYYREGAPDSAGTWQYDLESRRGWTRLDEPGTWMPVVYDGAVEFEPATNRLAIVGGRADDGNSPYRQTSDRSDVLERDLVPGGEWNTIVRSGRRARIPDGSSLVLDHARGRLLLVPGWDRGEVELQTVCLGSSQDWERMYRVGSASPIGRSYAAAAFDSAGDRTILFGGRLDYLELNDLWQAKTVPNLDHVYSWTRILPEGDAPSGRWGASSVFDPVRGRVIVFGGFGGRALGDTWALSLDGTPRWTRIATTGVQPPPRFAASAVYDSRRDGMIVFGGNATDDNDPAPLRDTWFLSFHDGDRWIPLATQGSLPVSRWYHAAVYDTPRDRMLVFWGRDRSTVRFDCAVLDLGGQPTWSAYTPQGESPSRLGHAVAYDPDADQVAIGGGSVYDPFGGPDVDDWYLALAPPPGGTPPPFTGPSYAVLGMYPNPTRAGVDVMFDLPEAAVVRTRIYDARGRLVRDLGSPTYAPGRHIVSWDGKADGGERPGAGIYFAHVRIGAREVTSKIVLLP